MNVNLKVARMKANLTQKELAEKAEVTTKYISCIESQGKIPSPKVMKKIADLTNVSVQELFFAEDGD